MSDYDLDDIARSAAARFDDIDSVLGWARDKAHNEGKYAAAYAPLAGLANMALASTEEQGTGRYQQALDEIAVQDDPRARYEGMMSWWDAARQEFDNYGFWNAGTPSGDAGDASDGGPSSYADVSMAFNAHVPEDAQAGQVWNARGGDSLWDVVRDAPAAFNKSAEPAYSMSLTASSRGELKAAIDELDRVRVRIGDATPDDDGAMVGSGDSIFDDVYELAVAEATPIYRQSRSSGPFGRSETEYVVHLDGFDPVTGDAPVFDESGVYIAQAEALDSTGSRMGEMVSDFDVMEVGDWTAQDAYDTAAEQAQETWNTLENSYLFGGKQEKKTIGEVSAEHLRGGRLGKNVRAIADDVIGDGIYHELVRPQVQKVLGRSAT